jgi:hypothetical protein
MLPNFKELTPMLLELLHKIEREGTLPNSFHKSSINLILKLEKGTCDPAVPHNVHWRSPNIIRSWRSVTDPEWDLYPFSPYQ